jgi:hypothetical protein
MYIYIRICTIYNIRRTSPTMVRENIFAKWSTGLWWLLLFVSRGHLDGTPALYFEVLNIVGLKKDCLEFLSCFSEMWDFTSRVLKATAITCHVLSSSSFSDIRNSQRHKIWGIRVVCISILMFGWVTWFRTQRWRINTLLVSPHWAMSIIERSECESDATDPKVLN